MALTQIQTEDIVLTESAAKAVRDMLEKRNLPTHALRVFISGGGCSGYQYGMALEGEPRASDFVMDQYGVKVVVDDVSLGYLRGAHIDYVDDIMGSGFKIENPNPLWTDPRALAVQEVIDTQINPGVAMHGGHVALLDVKDDVVYIALGGGCQGCGMADVTLKQGIEVLIQKAVPEIRQIIDTTDHAGGTNPYYQPAKGGQSPLA